MQKNDLIQAENTIYRVLHMGTDKLFVIDCIKRTMPKWAKSVCGTAISEKQLCDITEIHPKKIDELDADSRSIAYLHYNRIAGILPFLEDEQKRSVVINKVSEQFEVSKQTIRADLCLYLAYQSISVLAPKKTSHQKPLTQDEKKHPLGIESVLLYQT